MNPYPFLIRSKRVMTDPDLPPGPASILVEDGEIVEVLDFNFPTRYAMLDVGESVLMAGIVDTHAHINEPGRTDWEGFRTATRAAAAGGITTVLDMPLNSIPPTTTLAAFKTKSQEARKQCSVDFGLWGGVIPGNLSELEPMIREGIWGFKTFLCESGVDEFPMTREPELRAAMAVLADHDVPLLVHAELCTPVTAGGDARTYKHYLDSRPAIFEVEAIRMMIRLCRETKCRVHIVHLSAAEALPDIASAKAEGLRFTVETCPHYLALRAEDIADGDTHFKCAPPIRGSANQDKLWEGLKAGTIDQIVSDHSPCTPELKKKETGDFDKAWGGIAGLQFSLPVVWTEMHRRGIPLERVTGWMSQATAKLANLDDRKGFLAKGKDADILVFDPEALLVPTPDRVLHKHPVTPYIGKALRGRVEMTFLRGVCVYDNGIFPIEPMGGELRRPGEDAP